MQNEQIHKQFVLKAREVIEEDMCFCPECGERIIFAEGSFYCPECGFSQETLIQDL